MNFNSGGYRIHDIDCQRVSAVAQFLYRGYEVSMSQIFKPPTKVLVFADSKTNPVHEAYTVADAIEWINRQ